MKKMSVRYNGSLMQKFPTVYVSLIPAHYSLFLPTRFSLKRFFKFIQALEQFLFLEFFNKRFYI